MTDFGALGMIDVFGAPGEDLAATFSPVAFVANTVAHFGQDNLRGLGVASVFTDSGARHPGQEIIGIGDIAPDYLVFQNLSE